MNILIAGASGFVGKALVSSLQSHGHRLATLVRRKEELSPHAFLWNPAKGEIDLKAFEGIDAVINLSGENIFSGRWTEARKERILESRVNATKVLNSSIISLKTPPKVFIQASAVGFYGDGGEAIKDENSPPGKDFLAQVCKAWESALHPGVRTVILRFGIVLGAGGGLLGTVLPFFKLGLGSRLGSGLQWMSWIALEDLTSLFHFALTHPSLSGIINAVSPHPVTNGAFTNALCKALHRPQCFPLPSWLLRFLFGRQKADALLLGSFRVKSQKLQESGFGFLYPELEEALRYLLAP